MARLLALGFVAAFCYSALAAPVIDGSAGDPLYGAALAAQDTQTQFASLGRPDVCNGSELDAVYAAAHNNTLYMVLAGNLETSGNKLEIFFDARAGGQNRLLATNPGADPNSGLLRMCEVAGDPSQPGLGLTFSSGFQADFWVSVSCFGNPATVYVDYAEPYRTPSSPGEPVKNRTPTLANAIFGCRTPPCDGRR